MIEVDAALVAQGLQLDAAEFRTLHEAGKISTLCERGVGEDAGRFRFTFYYGRRRFRFVTNASGVPEETEAPALSRAGSGPG